MTAHEGLPPLAPDDGSWAEARDVRLGDRAGRAWVNGSEWRVVGAFQKTEFFLAQGRRRYRVWQIRNGDPWRAERVDDDLEGVPGLPRTMPLPPGSHTEAEVDWVRAANGVLHFPVDELA